MNSQLDNSALIRERILKYDNKGDFYFVLILKRRKDSKGHMVEGVNEDNRLIKHFFLYSLDYYDRKLDAIRKLCNDNDARAYILPQRRNDLTVLLALHQKVGELIAERIKNATTGLHTLMSQRDNLLAILTKFLENDGQNLFDDEDKRHVNSMLELKKKETTSDRYGQGIHFDHLIRSCVAGCHLSDRKRWLIDLDHDDACFKDMTDDEFNAYVERVIAKIGEIRHLYRMPEKFDLTVVPTPHGKHIVTEPFNKQEMNCPKLSKNPLPIWKADWLKEDAMTLIYSSLKKED